ncbi:MAG TPA: FlgO family outer membrane protein, partial [Anaeromyxobacter sp.]
MNANPSRLLPVLLSLLALAPPRASAEELEVAAKRVAGSILSQLSVRPPRLAIQSITVPPLKEGAGAGASGQGRAFAQALGAQLGAGGLQVRDWNALDQNLRETALKAALGGTPGITQLPQVQGMVVGELIVPSDGGPIRVTVRLLALPAGTVAASENARLDPPPSPPVATATPAPAPERLATEAASVDVAMRRMADALAKGVARLPGNARYQRIAVLGFSEVGDEAKKRELGKVVTAELSTNLRRDHGFLLVEREKIGSVLSEVKLGEMGLVDAKSAPKVGQLADAQALVVGSVAEAGGKFLVNARVVTTETAETLAAASESIQSATLVAFSADAVVLRSRKDAVFRSVLLPGFGQLYNRQPKKAAAFAAAEVAALGGAVAFQLLGAGAQKDYERQTTPGALGTDPAAAAADLRQTAEDRYRWRN